MNLKELLKTFYTNIPKPDIEVVNWTEIITYAGQLGLYCYYFSRLFHIKKMVINDTDQCDMNMVIKRLECS